jgi:hypothetical protein
VRVALETYLTLGALDLEAVKVGGVGTGLADSQLLCPGSSLPLGENTLLCDDLLDLLLTSTSSDGEDKVGQSNALDGQDLTLNAAIDTIGQDLRGDTKKANRKATDGVRTTPRQYNTTQSNSLHYALRLS